MSKVKELKLCFEAADENNLSIAETWLERIDRPWMNEPDANKRAGTGIDRRAVRQMKGAAVEEMLELAVMSDCLNDFADRSGYIVRRLKFHVVPAVDNDLLAVGR